MNFELANANSGQSTTVFKSEHVLALAVFQGKPDESAFDHFFKGKSADFDWYEALKVGFKDVRNALIVVVNYRHGTLFTLDIGHVARAHFFVGDECTNLFIEDSDVRKVFFCVSLVSCLPSPPLPPSLLTPKKKNCTGALPGAQVVPEGALCHHRGDQHRFLGRLAARRALLRFAVAHR